MQFGCLQCIRLILKVQISNKISTNIYTELHLFICYCIFGVYWAFETGTIFKVTPPSAGKLDKHTLTLDAQQQQQ